MRQATPQIGEDSTERTVECTQNPARKKIVLPRATKHEKVKKKRTGNVHGKKTSFHNRILKQIKRFNKIPVVLLR